MFKIYLLLACCLHLVATSYHENEEEASGNDFLRIVNDLKRTLKLDDVQRAIDRYFEQAVQDGHSYSYGQFKKDLTSNIARPTILLRALHRGFWMFAVHSSLHIKHGVVRFKDFFTRFMRKKCDLFFGKDGVYHPWSIIEDSKQATVFMAVYGIVFTIFISRFLNAWNLLLYLAVIFLLKSYGGTIMVFEWFLCATGFLWYLVDMIIQHPSKTALVIVTICFLGFIQKAVLKFGPLSDERRIEKRRVMETLELRLDSVEESNRALLRKMNRISELIERKS